MTPHALLLVCRHGKSRSRRGFVILVSVILLLTLFATARATPSTVSTGGACITCHTRDSTPHIAAWLTSQHHRAGVGCADCHRRHPSVGDADNPHPATDPTQAGADSIEQLCGSCHTEVLRVFNTSPFVKQGHAVNNAPTCVTCHGAEGSDLVSLAGLGQKCRACHRDGGVAGHPDVPDRAVKLMRDLRRLSLARVLVKQEIYRYTQTQANPEASANAQRQLRLLNRLTGDHVLEWHRFQIDSVEANIDSTLQKLGKIHEQITTR